MESILSLLFPSTCPGCGVPAEPVCADCAARLVPAPAAPVPEGLDDCVAVFSFEGVAADLVAGVKFRGRRAAIGWLAETIVSSLPTALPPERDPADVDVVTWPPTTPEHRRRRGADQAALLATAVARRLHRPVRPLLRRVSEGSQTGRTRAERSRVAFVAGATPARVLVVDDVTTTGATLTAAARALRAQGAKHVVGATVARTPRNGPGARFRQEIPAGIHHFVAVENQDGSHAA